VPGGGGGISPSIGSPSVSSNCTYWMSRPSVLFGLKAGSPHLALISNMHMPPGGSVTLITAASPVLLNKIRGLYPHSFFLNGHRVLAISGSSNELEQFHAASLVSEQEASWQHLASGGCASESNSYLSGAFMQNTYPLLMHWSHFRVSPYSIGGGASVPVVAFYRIRLRKASLELS
jgi:hypothetical protein